MPPLLVETSIGVAAAFAMLAARIPFADFSGERAPYALNFLAVVLAAVVGGWRSGLVALVLGQLLVWYAIIPPHFSMAASNPDTLGALLLATLSQLLILLVMALYQREIDKGTLERERRMELLQHALREIDHRTTNNYQTVLALIHLQGQRARSEELRDALRQVAERIGAIAKASERLALRSATLESVRLDDHLCELCGHIERGLSRDEVQVGCEVSPCTVHPDRAVAISIIVNELVTNALKHAFSDGAAGRVEVIGRVDGQGLELTVSDNGTGIKSTKPRNGGGLGTKLVQTFVSQLGADHKVDTSDRGTTHRIMVPSLS